MRVSGGYGMSHPSRGAWIEISHTLNVSPMLARRTPHGVRGLKFDTVMKRNEKARRTPHGVRGLKSSPHRLSWRKSLSHPSRGAWIEIHRVYYSLIAIVSHPSRGAWIEIPMMPQETHGLIKSHPSRGAWIEIINGACPRDNSNVAPLTGCVD